VERRTIPLSAQTRAVRPSGDPSRWINGSQDIWTPQKEGAIAPERSELYKRRTKEQTDGASEASGSGVIGPFLDERKK